MRRALAPLLCIALSACALTKTRQEMVDAKPIAATVCSKDLSKDVALEQLQRAWNQCFAKGQSVGVASGARGPIIYPESGIAVEVQQADDAIVLYARNSPPRGTPPMPFDHAIFLMAEIKETGACRSEISVRATNDHWKKRALQTELWLNDPNARSPAASCGR